MANVGERVKITYKIPDERNNKVITGIFLGMAGFGNTKYALSGRPVFGTAYVPKEWVVQMEILESRR